MSNVLKPNYSKPRPETSQIYLKYQRQLKRYQAKIPPTSQWSLQRRISQQHTHYSKPYEKLYELSPRKKKILLQEARLLKITRNRSDLKRTGSTFDISKESYYSNLDNSSFGDSENSVFGHKKSVESDRKDAVDISKVRNRLYSRVRGYRRAGTSCYKQRFL